MFTIIVVALIAYAIGSVNSSVIISKKMAGFDVREKGSGNAGTTNMLRSVGKKAAAITLVCDILKGVVAILISFVLGMIIPSADAALLVQLAGLMVIVGHTYPVFFQFKGGKGVATSLGVLICINWEVGLICLILALVIIAVTRMVSAGACIAAVLYPILTLFGVQAGKVIVEGNYIIFSLLLAALVLVNHRENIKRILEGKENKISFSK